jgi:predicted RecB family nuclease
VSDPFDLSFAGAAGPRQFSPTDLAQFIRLEQCQRYLRLRLHQRAASLDVVRAYGVVPQTMPPLLTRSGADFEAMIEQAVRRRYPAANLAAQAGDARPPDNQRVVEAIRTLPLGDVLVLFQPRLEVDLDGWLVRGDIDLLRIERTGDGAWHLLVVDTKSSASAKLEHRLQVACYHAMLRQLLADAALVPLTIQTAIAFRGNATTPAPPLTPAAQRQDEELRTAAADYLGTRSALLEVIAEPADYLDVVRDLVTGPDAVARRVTAAPFASLPYHLSRKCDGCLFNELCMKWSAAHDDLALLPHVTAGDTAALHRAGIMTTRDLATLRTSGHR